MKGRWSQRRWESRKVTDPPPLYSNIYLNLLDQVWHKRRLPGETGEPRCAATLMMRFSFAAGSGTHALQAFEAIAASRMGLTINREKDPGSRS